MTLDEKLRFTLAGTASRVAYVPPTSPEEIKRRGRRRKTRRKIVWTVPAVLVLLGALAMTIPFDPNPRSPAVGEQVDTIEVADLTVAVTDSKPVSSDPDIWLGLRGPSPTFDTSALGPDLSFSPGEPSSDDLKEENMANDGWPTAVRAVYLGELDGDQFYIYSAPAPSIWDRIFEVVYGNFSGDTLGTSLNCCSGGDMDHEGGLPGFSHSYSTEGGVVTNEVIAAEWLGLSTDVSVVAYQLDGAFMGWQTPVGGVVSLRFEDVPDELTMIALDRNGREVNRFELTGFGSAPPDESVGSATTPGADWAPLESDGAEIRASDISDPELHDSIGPLPTDRLFLVELEGGELIVRVRSGSPQAFAASCEFLERVDLPPAWERTCLE